MPVSLDDGLTLEATVTVDRVGSPEPWGFGIGVDFEDRPVLLRSLQGKSPAVELPGLNAVPFEHGREGVYRMKLRIVRREGQPSMVQGKLWQGDREPDGWLLEAPVGLSGAGLRVAFETLRCGATFGNLRIRTFPADSE